MPYLVECNNCHAKGFTNHGGNPDAAVRCETAADDPPGSAEGTCCTEHESHEHHTAAVRETGDARCRPVTIIALPGSATVGIG